MDFRTPDLTKIVDFEKLEKQASQGAKNGKSVDKMQVAMMFLKPMMKSLPKKAKWGIGFAILALITGVLTMLYGLGYLVFVLATL